MPLSGKPTKRVETTRKPVGLGDQNREIDGVLRLLQTVAAPKKAQRRRIYHFGVPDFGYWQVEPS